MLTLAHAAQILNCSGDAAYHGLWEYFVQAILQYRIAPYFPQLSPPTVALHVLWASLPTSTSTSTSSASNTEGKTEEQVESPGKNVSICAYMVQCIRALTAQSARAKHTHPRESLCSSPKTVRGFFKLVSQYVLFYGEGIDAEDLEDLEEACGKFRKKTVSMEVRCSVCLIVFLLLYLFNSVFFPFC